ncbi:MAG: cytochrome b/b6 domain-containing protein [Panacagrimonas sp.]
MIWDLPTRIFHWLLALSFAVAYLSAKLGPAWMYWHLRAGYLMAALLLFRLVWGLCGSQTARFGTFLKGPRAVVAYLRDVASRTPIPHVGHNPSGGWMVVTMLATLASVGITGFFADDLVVFSGPLAACVSSEAAEGSARYHVLASNIALALVGLHLVAIGLYSWVLGQDLIRPMTGYRSRKAIARPSIRFVGNGVALIVFSLAALVIWVLAYAGLCP